MQRKLLSESEIRMLFNEHFVSMCIFAERYLHDYESGRDAVSDVFYKIWTKRDSLDNISNFKSYLFLSVKNYCLDILRHKVSQNKLSQEYYKNISSESYFEIECVREQVYTMLDEAISKQPEQTRKILRMKLQGLKNDEIATVLGISVNSVNTLKTNGYKSLKKLLGNKWELCLLLFFKEW